MAIGDYIKSLLNNGYGPPYRNAAYHNKQENKIYDLDQATAALQTDTAALQTATTAANLLAAMRTQDSLFQGRLWVSGRQYLAGDLVYKASDGLIYLCLANTSTIAPDYTNAAIEGVTWKKLVWTTVSDGNGGQPPAPKPKGYISGLTQGEFIGISLGPSATWTNPGGTWIFFYLIQDSGGTKLGSNAGITNGNLSTIAGEYLSAFAWRIL